MSIAGLARFGVKQPVPVNLLAVTILVAGATLGLTLEREFFPEITPDRAVISIREPGANPQHIQDAIAIKVEDRMADIDAVKQIDSRIHEGGGSVTVEFRSGVDLNKAFDDVKRAVDAIDDLPPDAEPLQVQLLEPRLPVIMLTLYGDSDEQALKRAIRGIQNDLQSLDQMGEVVPSGIRDYEISIEIDKDAMLEMGLELGEVQQAVGAWMQEVPGGTLRTDSTDIQVRTIGVAEQAETVREVVVGAGADGSLVRLADVARVRDTLEDAQLVYRFNGRPAATLTIFKVGDQDMVHMAEMVRAYVEARQGRPFEPRPLTDLLSGGVRRQAWELGQRSTTPLPEGTALAVQSDLARFVEDRLDLLVRNAIYGAILVFMTLLVFLNWRTATWVGVGLVISIAGTLVLMSAGNITLNLMTMFALIVVLGLLVDDAIVVAENIQTRHDRGEPALTAAVTGTEQVGWPVVATVLTSIVAFLPLLFIAGQIGDMLGALPIVVAVALGMSLLQALLILPSHMGHTLARRDRLRPGRVGHAIRRIEAWRDRMIQQRLTDAYAAAMRWVLHFRYIALAVAVAVLLLSVGMVAGNRLGFVFLEETDAETIVVDVQLPVGTPLDQTQRTAATIEQAATGQPEVRHVATLIGQVSDIDTGQVRGAAPHGAQMFIELYPVEARHRPSADVIDRIRQSLQGRIDEVERIRFSEIGGGPGGPDITIRVRGADGPQRDQAVADLKHLLAGYPGVTDIADDQDRGQTELRIRLREQAMALGLSQQELARQVRGFFFGLEAHVFAAEREDVKVQVRLDETSRRRLATLEQGWIILPPAAGGDQGDDTDRRRVPLSEVASIEEGATYATINRVDRQQAVTVTAEVVPGLSPEDITAAMAGPLDEIRQRYPGLNIVYAGRQEQLRDAFATLPWGFLAALLMIYVILAWLFSSYLQPLLVMVVIPFGLIGVIWGHWLTGYDLTFLSLIGFVALSGVVVNASLIFVKFYNTERARGVGLVDGLVNAGRARLRAILLTTITTFLGLTPLMLETSFQARFLIPMAIAIAMGLVAATFLVLMVLPCIIRIFDDVKRIAYFLWHGRPMRADPYPQVIVEEPAGAE